MLVPTSTASGRRTARVRPAPCTGYPGGGNRAHLARRRSRVLCGLGRLDAVAAAHPRAPVFLSSAGAVGGVRGSRPPSWCGARAPAGIRPRRRRPHVRVGSGGGESPRSGSAPGTSLRGDPVRGVALRRVFRTAPAVPDAGPEVRTIAGARDFVGRSLDEVVGDRRPVRFGYRGTWLRFRTGPRTRSRRACRERHSPRPSWLTRGAGQFRLAPHAGPRRQQGRPSALDQPAPPSCSAARGNWPLVVRSSSRTPPRRVRDGAFDEP